MSKYFRSPGSDSSNSHDSSVDKLPENFSPPPKLEDALQPITVQHTAASSFGEVNADLLLHALLEERCMNEVRREYPNRHGTDLEGIANERYQALCRQLTPLNLIADGLDHARHASTRNTYRSGLDILMRGGAEPSVSNPRARVLPTARRLLTENPSSPVDTMASLQLRRYTMPRSLIDPELFSIPVEPVLGPVATAESSATAEISRYFREFEEIKLLGKGGYGAVFHVQNKVDEGMTEIHFSAPLHANLPWCSGHYAIKKIPFSDTCMDKIRVRGPQEIDRLLREVRTLARLDHPNIVRYYGGWLETAQFTGLPQNSMTSFSSHEFGNVEELSSDDAAGGAADERLTPVLRRVITQSDSFDNEIVLFETSASMTRSQSLVLQEKSRTSALSITHERTGGPLKATLASDSGQSLGATQPASTRHEWTPSDSVTNLMEDDRILKTSQPVLTLCVQMSLHPFTLADFLSPHSDAGLTHCYHIHPSIDILLAILDGCEYLHDSDIIHRDLKPANILMGENRNPRSSARGSVDLFLCQPCRDEGRATAACVDVRICDFGLVSTLAQPELDNFGASHPVGTEVYRPTYAISNASAALDIFALGIVAFELFWTKEFGTRKSASFPPLRMRTVTHRLSVQLLRLLYHPLPVIILEHTSELTSSPGSERYDTIKTLKSGQFPFDFSRRIGDASGHVEGCIRSMLMLQREESEGGDEATIASLRRRWRAIQADLL